MSTRIVIGLFLLAASTFGQDTRVGLAPREKHYPRLIQAELPLYPPIAWAAHVSGTVEIRVAVEHGAVADAQVKSVDIQITDPQHRTVYSDRAKMKVSPYLSNPSLANVKTWQFQPEGRTTFLVTYVYKIEGEQTALPENPKVELDLPRLVTITAKPFKPSCSGCTDRGGGVTADPAGGKPKRQ